jgi:formate dehydrogenase iron-sulfur subunit
MELSRRDFIKVSGMGLGATFLGVRAARAAPPASDPLAILYDSSKCVGCRACQNACKRWNNLPPESTDPQGIYESPLGLSATTWTFIGLSQESEQDWHFINYQCMHCVDAACVTVCPSSALFKDERGFTAYDADKCMGCGYCTKFCPFGVPHLQSENLVTGKAVAAKCTFCQDRVWEGLGGPSCAESCPVGALTWGNQTDLLSQANERVAQLQAMGLGTARLYGESQSGGLHRLTILFGDPARYGLPSTVVSPTTAKVWQNVLQPAGELAFGAAILASLTAFLLARRNIHMEEVE